MHVLVFVPIFDTELLKPLAFSVMKAIKVSLEVLRVTCGPAEKDGGWLPWGQCMWYRLGTFSPALTWERRDNGAEFSHQ